MLRDDGHRLLPEGGRGRRGISGRSGCRRVDRALQQTLQMERGKRYDHSAAQVEAAKLSLSLTCSFKNDMSSAKASLPPPPPPSAPEAEVGDAGPSGEAWGEKSPGDVGGESALAAGAPPEAVADANPEMARPMEEAEVAAPSVPIRGTRLRLQTVNGRCVSRTKRTRRRWGGGKRTRRGRRVPHSPYLTASWKPSRILL